MSITNSARLPHGGGLPGDHRNRAHRGLLKAGAAAAALVLAAAASAQPQGMRVRDLVQVEGARRIPLEGTGIVVGLNGQGEPARGRALELLSASMANMDQLPPLTELASRNVAVVKVQAEMLEIQRPGTTIDVHVGVVGEARSLQGGILLMTPLRSPLAGANGPEIFALAWGPIIADGTARTGNPTTGTIPGGATVEVDIPRRYANGRPWLQEKGWHFHGRNGPVEIPVQAIRLLVQRPEWTTAQVMVAQEINDEFMSEVVVPLFPDRDRNAPATVVEVDVVAAMAVRRFYTLNPIARATDAAIVEVRLPTAEELGHIGIPDNYIPGFLRDPVYFLQKILDSEVSVESARGRAVVVINSKAGTISYSNNVYVLPGEVRVGGNPVRFAEGQTLSAALGNLQVAFTPEQLIDVVRTAHRNGLIQAELITQ